MDVSDISNPTIRTPPPQKPWWTPPVQSWGWYTFCCSLRFWQFVHHPLEKSFSDPKSFVVAVYGWWSPNIFYFFLLGGGGRGSPRRQEGEWFFYWTWRGGFPGGGRMAGRVSVANGGNLGGGGGWVFFFRGRSVHQASKHPRNTEKNSWKTSKHQGISLLREYQGKSKHQGMEDQGGDRGINENWEEMRWREDE